MYPTPDGLISPDTWAGLALLAICFGVVAVTPSRTLARQYASLVRGWSE